MSDVNVYTCEIIKSIYLPFEMLSSFNDKITEIFVKPVLEVKHLCYYYFSKVLK